VYTINEIAHCAHKDYTAYGYRPTSIGYKLSRAFGRARPDAYASENRDVHGGNYIRNFCTTM